MQKRVRIPVDDNQIWWYLYSFTHFRQKKEEEKQKEVKFRGLISMLNLKQLSA